MHIGVANRDEIKAYLKMVAENRITDDEKLEMIVNHVVWLATKNIIVLEEGVASVAG